MFFSWNPLRTTLDTINHLFHQGYEPGIPQSYATLLPEDDSGIEDYRR
jgi:hypothetical protein